MLFHCWITPDVLYVTFLGMLHKEVCHIPGISMKQTAYTLGINSNLLRHRVVSAAIALVSCLISLLFESYSQVMRGP